MAKWQKIYSGKLSVPLNGRQQNSKEVGHQSLLKNYFWKRCQYLSSSLCICSSLARVWLPKEME